MSVFVDKNRIFKDTLDITHKDSSMLKKIPILSLIPLFIISYHTIVAQETSSKKNINQESKKKKDNNSKDIQTTNKPSGIRQTNKANKSKTNKNEEDTSFKEEFNVKQDPKKIYSYTWKSEKQKIFEPLKKHVYGKKTTKYIYFSDIKHNLEYEYRDIEDTDVITLHKWTLNEKYKYHLQNLGVDGTPARNVFFDIPEDIGTTSGFDNFNLYFKHPLKIKLYDTKSPYTYIFVIPGKKIAKLIFEYSQNINENWNIGFTFHNGSIASPFEQYPKSKYNLNRMVDFHTHYQNPQFNYNFILTLSIMKCYSKIYQPNSNDDIKLLKYDKVSKSVNYNRVSFPNINLKHFKNKKPKLMDNGSIVEQQRQNAKLTNKHIYLNVYNQYEPFSAKQFYYQFGCLLDSNSLGEKDSDETENDQAKTSPFMKINIWSIINEGGFKSQYGEDIFFRLYTKRIDLLRKYNHLELEREDKMNLHRSEHYIGLSAKQVFKNSVLSLDSEYLIPYHYKIGCTFTANRFTFSLKHAKKKLPFIYEEFEFYRLDGNLVKLEDFNKDELPQFSHPLSLKINSSYKIYDSNSLSISPNVMGLFIGKGYKLFDVFLCPGVDVNITYGDFHLDNSILSSFKVIDRFSHYATPSLIIHSSFYYLTSFYKDKLHFCSGVDFFFRTKYNPSQFLHTNTNIYLFDTDKPSNDGYGYPIFNLFVNLTYGNLGIFFKITHINQGIFGPGYFTTDKLPGQNISYDLGLSWRFYN